MADVEQALFEVFNARHLPPEDVARTFVPPPCFGKLSGRSHTVLVGPRGSGKTTLLKMLQPQALGVWKHDQANEYQAAINYIGVFIPADISWGAQLEALGFGRLAPAAHDLLATASFTTHVMRALIEVMTYRIEPIESGAVNSFLKIQCSESFESSLTADLATLWKLHPRLPTFLALKQSLRQRMVDLRSLANRGAMIDAARFSEELHASTYLHLHFLETVIAAIDLFNDLANERSRNWALLFDELEIAPQWLQDEVIRSTRSVNQRILIKLALSPFSSSATKLLETPIAPAPGEDFLQIPLWYAEREKGERFCEELWRTTVRTHGTNAQDPQQALGPSYFEQDGVSGEYGPGSLWAQRFTSLARRDRSFARYLADHQIDPTNLNATPVHVRDRTVRKAAPVVAVREYFRKDDASGRQRSRKSDALYAGASSVFAITEGNPRLFKALANGFVRYIAETGVPVPESVQGSEIRKGAERFLAMLGTAPAHDRMGGPTLPELLDAIGTYFFDRVVRDEFNPEPPLSFRVGVATDRFLLELLQIALNRGAIVYVPDTDAESVLTSLAGKRFRLCYLLAAHYGLPLRLGKETPLEKVLSTRRGPSERSGDLFPE